MRATILTALLLCLAGCATGRPDTTLLDRTLYTYAGAIRWGEIDAAADFFDPEQRDRLVPSPIERKRIDQLQITAYNVRGKEQVSDTEFVQLVEIRLVNRHTQVERTVVDRQVWRWDAEARQWWLTTGLPDFSPR